LSKIAIVEDFYIAHYFGLYSTGAQKDSDKYKAVKR